MNAMPIDSMFRNEKNINLMLFNEIDNFIEVYNNSVIELVQCFGTSFFGRIDPKHCMRSITYKYIARPLKCHNTGHDSHGINLYGVFMSILPGDTRS